MSKRALILLAPGFEEIEAITPLDVFRRAGVDAISASITKEKAVPSARNIKIVADKNIDEIITEDFDLIYLPGGLDGTKNLSQDERVIKLLKRQLEQQRLIAAICAAPTILDEHGISEGKKLTCYPSCQDWIKKSTVINEKIVYDNYIYTSQGPGTALEFSLFLLGVLLGEEKKKEIADAMLFNR